MPPVIRPYFDATALVGAGAAAGPPPPWVVDASPAALRCHAVAFLAKRYVDMRYVTGLSRAEADRRVRPRPAGHGGGFESDPDLSIRAAEIDAAWRMGRIAVDDDPVARRVTVRWAGDPALGHADATGTAVAPAGYGGIVLGPHAELAFEPRPIARAVPDRSRPWPLGEVAELRHVPALEAAIDALLAGSPGIYGVMVATPDAILAERYGEGGARDRPTPSWSMTKAVTAALVGRMIQEGWIGSVYDRAPAPLWRDPRGAHAAITIDDLLRMRAGLAFQAVDGSPGGTLHFESIYVYCDGEDAFDVAQRAIVATRPGAAYRYINTGLNVLGAILRDRIAARGLPYPETIYGLLADRIGMASFQHSADRFGNLVASGSGFATLRDYARFGLLHVEDGVWDGRRLLPEGWVDYVTQPSHAGSEYAACFRTNSAATFPSLARDVAWASGASDQRIILLRPQGTVIAVTNETDHPMDMAALDRLAAAAVRVQGG